MKENTLDVLFYLFDNFPEIDDGSSEERESLDEYLRGAGFLPAEINRAFSWLENLGDDAQLIQAPISASAIRIYTIEEQHWLDAEARSYLMFLEQAGIMTPEAREQVIDRVLELEDDDFNLDRLKWVILMVLLNRPDEDNSFFWTDGLTLDGTQPVYH